MSAAVPDVPNTPREATERLESVSTKLRGLRLNSVSAGGALRGVTGLLGKLGPYGAAAAAGIGLAIGAISGITAALLNLGRRAHVIDDLATSTTLSTREVQQLGKAFIGTTGSYEQSQRLAESLSGTLTSLADRYFDVTRRADLLRSLNVGPQSLGQLGFNIDDLVSGDPLAVIEEIRQAVERGVTTQELRIGLGAAGFDSSVITELVQATESADAYNAAVAAFRTPTLDDDALMGFQRFNNSIAGIQLQIQRELTPVLNGIAPIVENIGSEIADAIPRGIQWFREFREENDGLFRVLGAIGGQVLPFLGQAISNVGSYIEAYALGVRNLVSIFKIGFDSVRGTIDAVRENLESFQLGVFRTAKGIVDALEPIARFVGLGDELRAAQEALTERIGAATQERDLIRERRAATQERIAIERQHIVDNYKKMGEIFTESVTGTVNRYRELFSDVGDALRASPARDLEPAYASAPSLGRSSEPILDMIEGRTRDAPMVSMTNTYNIDANANLDDIEAVLRRNEERQIRSVQEVLG